MERARGETILMAAEHGSTRDPGHLIEVRRLQHLNELHRCEALQGRVWGPEDVVRVPALVMVQSLNNGGFAFGAFAGEELVGFVLASPGLTDAGHVKQCSILMAVDPAWQNSGVGYRLKLAQREAALAQGLDLITWTFDPLASANSHLNLQKLGCVATKYFIDLYGTADSGLNAGLPTDRLLAEWWIRKPAVADRLVSGRLVPPVAPVAAPAIDEVAIDPRTGLPVLRRADLGRNEPKLLLEIPESIRAVKLADLDLARAWRNGVREVFQHYFAHGYRAVGFHRLPCNGRVRHCFLLDRVTE